MVNRPTIIDGVKYFKCKKCGEVKPLNKCYFHINTMYSTGFNSKCKSCVKKERESKPKVKYITRAELEEENKKLNIIIENTKIEQEADRKHIEELEEENKKLNEKVRFLEECLDRKEKVNKSLREENKKLKHENRYRAGIVDILPKGKGHIAEETIQDLQDRIKELNEENETLKEELISRIRQPKNVPYGKGVAEFMEEDTLQELRDLGKI